MNLSPCDHSRSTLLPQVLNVMALNGSMSTGDYVGGGYVKLTPVDLI